MVMLKPFKAYRPRRDVDNKVAALPYDVMNSEEAREMVKDNEYSFLHIDKAEIDLDESINIYDDEVYSKARANLDKFMDEGVLVEDSKPSIYVYRLIMNGRAQTGIVACSSIDDYANNIIKKHEKTREDKEIDRIKHVSICGAHTGPIFLTYRDNEDINKIVDEVTKQTPIHDFTAEDNVKHIVWAITDEELIGKIQNKFEEVPNSYIADGHHRTASAVKVGFMKREENPDYTGEEDFNFFLSVLFPSSHLEIMDYNRLVKDTNNLTVEELLNAISEKFEIEASNEKVKPAEEHTFGMYVDGKWFKLKAKEGTFNTNHTLETLDVSILQDNLLDPILGIKDPRKDNRIEFVGGIRGIDALAKMADKCNGISFNMYPTTINQLMEIADIDETMPPKSTWFEPKLRSGLFVHKI
ncbi:MAG: DUF1015 domain-containing protein [Clostridiaceae bacterium]